jgi:hypothetical protein
MNFAQTLRDRTPQYDLSGLRVFPRNQRKKKNAVGSKGTEKVKLDNLLDPACNNIITTRRVQFFNKRFRKVFYSLFIFFTGVHSIGLIFARFQAIGNDDKFCTLELYQDY